MNTSSPFRLAFPSLDDEAIYFHTSTMVVPNILTIICR